MHMHEPPKTDDPAGAPLAERGTSREQMERREIQTLQSLAGQLLTFFKQAGTAGAESRGADLSSIKRAGTAGAGLQVLGNLVLLVLFQPRRALERHDLQRTRSHVFLPVSLPLSGVQFASTWVRMPPGCACRLTAAIMRSRARADARAQDRDGRGSVQAQAEAAAGGPACR